MSRLGSGVGVGGQGVQFKDIFLSPQKEKDLSEDTEQGSVHPSKAQGGLRDGGGCCVTDGAQVI